MPKENNKMQVDIDTLKKQNVNDLLSIKELYKRIEELGEKITQVKYIDNTLVKKIKKEYENFKKIILDENVQAKLSNDVKTINSQQLKLTNDVETINSQMNTNVNNLNKKINEVATTGTTVEVIKNKITELAKNGTITYDTVTPEMTTFINVGKSLNLFNPNNVIDGSYYSKSSDGIIVLKSNSKYSCVKIKIVAQKTYTVTSNGFTIYFSKIDSNIAEGLSFPTGTNTFTLTGNRTGEYYAYISYRNDTNPTSSFMVVEGGSLPSEFIPYESKKMLDNVIKIDLLSLADTPLYEEIYYVGENRKYKTLTSCLNELKDNHNNKVIYIDGGNYDVFEEIGGSKFALTIDDKISSWKDVSIIIPDNTKIIGLGNVVLDFSPNLDEISVKGSQYLSCLNVIYKNFYLENVTITCENCRYGIHDETGGTYGGGVHSYKNVKVYKKSTKMGMSQAFGCGFSPKETLDFDCCYFEAPSIPFSCHNNGSFDVDNAIIKAINTIFSSNSNNTKSVRLGNVNGKQVKICVNFSNCYIKNGIQVKNESTSERPNAYEVTLLNCNDVPVEVLNSTNIYTAKVFR